MDGLNARRQQSLPVWLGATAWVAVFLSPSACFLLVVFWNRLGAPALPVGLLVVLFGLIPVLALLACGLAIWRTKLAVSWRVGCLFSTLLAMALQVGVLLVIIRTMLLTAISYAQ